MKRTLFFLMFLSCSFLVSGQFRATMKSSYSGVEKEYQVWSDGTNYRYEFKEKEQPMAMIVRPEENKAYVMMPDKKAYRPYPCDDFAIVMTDPVQGCVYIAHSYIEKIAGHEEAAGYDCLKKEYYRAYKGDTSIVFIVLFSEELNFPVKMIQGAFKTVKMELSGIQKWKPEKDYFVLPGGYAEVDENMQPVSH